jgi:hypothetical protein
MKQAFSYVRFSTPAQEMGDSERRQLALAKAHCKQHELTLTDSMADKGISAFQGQHDANGRLGRLLKQMSPGQVLLIEDCDREPIWVTCIKRSQSWCYRSHRAIITNQFLATSICRSPTARCTTPTCNLTGR